MTIKESFRIIFSISLSILISLVILCIGIIKNHRDFKENNYILHQMYCVVDELRETSNDLTRLSRTYIVTLDKVYEKEYWDILAVINGEKARFDGKTISIIEFVKQIGAAEEEIEKVKEVKSYLDLLVITENMAMNAAKGIFLDESGTYTKNNKPDFELARLLVFDKKYHSDKEKIIKSIDDFSLILNKHRKVITNKCKDEEKVYFTLSVILVVILLFLMFIWYLYVDHVITKPIGKIANISKKITEGDFNQEKVKINSENEIGMLSQAFNRMITSLKEVIKENEMRLDQLRESEKRYEIILEAGEMGFWDWNLKTDELIVNEEYTKMLGYRLEEFKPHINTWNRLLHDDDKKNCVEDELNHYEKHDTTWCGDFRMRSKERKWVWVSSKGRVVERSKDGKPIRVVGTHEDITKRKKKEEKLRQLNKKLLFFFRETPLGYMEFDKDNDFIITSWNPAAERIFGYTENEAVGKNVIDIIVPDNIKNDVEKVGEKLKCKVGGVRRINKNITKDGRTIICKWYNTILIGDKGEIIGWASLVEDITERKRAEEELQNAKEQAERANKAKSEFLANMSHEIRTPMNAVIGFTELLDNLITDKKQKNYLDSIKTGGKGLLKLINDILDLSKIEEGKMELEYSPIDIYCIFNEIKKIFHVKIRDKNLKLIIEVDKDLPNFLILDEVRLRQIIFNLIGNAIKFTEKGYIKMSAKKTYSNVNKNRIDLIISIQDTGIGIPKEQQSIIFESFEQQEGQSCRKYGGTGLGLTISKRLIEMMGGSILLESNVGEGSIFKIVLKNIAAASDKKIFITQTSFDFEKILFDKEIVMIVDDNKENREIVKENFKDTNLQIIEAENGKKALVLAQKYKPDLIFMDIRMPVMDGYETIKQMKNNDMLKNIPVIAVTASVMKADIDKILEHKFDSYLKKPVNRKKLFQEAIRFLKYSIREKTKVGNSSFNFNNKDEKSIAIIKKRVDFIEHIDNEVRHIWKNVCDKESIEDIKAFGNMIKYYGYQYGLIIFVQYGEELLEYVSNFDVDNMRRVLKSYPDIIKRIKTVDTQGRKKSV